MKFFFVGEARPVGNCFSRPAGGPNSFLCRSQLPCVKSLFFCVCVAYAHLFTHPSFEHKHLACAKVLGMIGETVLYCDATTVQALALSRAGAVAAPRMRQQDSKQILS